MAVHVYFVTARAPKAVRLKHALVELGVSSMILMFIRSGTLGENLTRKQVYDQREEKRTVGTTCITKKHCDCFLATVKVIETKSWNGWIIFRSSFQVSDSFPSNALFSSQSKTSHNRFLRLLSPIFTASLMMSGLKTIIYSATFLLVNDKQILDKPIKCNET